MPENVVENSRAITGQLVEPNIWLGYRGRELREVRERDN